MERRGTDEQLAVSETVGIVISLSYRYLLIVYYVLALTKWFILLSTQLIC